MNTVIPPVQDSKTNIGSPKYIKDILLWQYNYHTNQYLFNSNLLKEFGYTQSELSNNDVWNTLLTDESLTRFNAFIDNPLTPIKNVHFDAICKNGTLKPFKLKIKVLEKFNKEYYNLLIGQLEILEERDQESELKNNLFKRFFDLDPHAKVIMNLESVLEYVNPAFEQLTGKTQEELIGQPLVKLIESAGLHETIQAKEMIYSAKQGQDVTLNIRLKSNLEDGKPVRCKISYLNGKLLVYTI